MGYPLDFGSKNKASKATVIFGLNYELYLLVSNILSNTFKRQGRNNRTGLLIECDQKSEIKYAAFSGQIVSIR